MKKTISYILSLILLLISLNVTAYEVSDYKASAINYLAENTATPSIGSIGGDWTVFALARSGYDNDEFYETYYNKVKSRLEENQSDYIDDYSTDNSRVIIALTAAGYDASDVDGYNLLTPLADFDYTVRQGINGALYALIALDTKPYELPEGSENSREALLEYILSKQTSDGGWAQFGDKGDTDLTAIAIQALAPYYETNTDAAAAADKGIDFLSQSQESNGGYSSWEVKNIESTAQVLCMMSAMNISVDDERFIKDGHTIIDGMLEFYDTDTGAFRHTIDGIPDRMATEQSAYALVAYDRYSKGLSRIYDMSDVTIKSAENNEDENIIYSDPYAGEYTDEELTPTASPEPTIPPSPTPAPVSVSFNDISESEFQNEILSLADRGIITGKFERIFEPYATMTRAEYAAIIARALDLKGGSDVFEDVSENDWFYNYVCAAYASGIIKGISETQFKPHGTITREEAAVMCSRAAVLSSQNTSLAEPEISDILSQFDDYTDVSSWALAGTAFCYKNKILKDEVMEIKPSENIKRDEVAYMIYGLLELSK